MIKIYKDIIELFKFKRKKYKIGFFVENKNILEYLLPYIEIKSHREKIFIISFEDLDLQLKNVKIYTFHSNLIRELFFLILNTRYLYSSTPGLNYNLFKRSKKYNCKYIFIQHSLCSMTMIYPSNSFDFFDAIQAVTNYQYKELHEIKKKSNLNFKVFKSNYLFLKNKVNQFKQKSKKNVLIAPTWNTNFYDLNIHLEISKILIQKNISFDIRPHPMSLKKNEVSLINLNKLNLSTNLSTNLNFFDYDLVISDWSGIFIEFAVLGKKVLLVDTKKKILNKNYKNYDNVPAEILFREKMSTCFSVNNIKELIDEVKKVVNEKRNVNPINIDKYYFEM